MEMFVSNALNTDLASMVNSNDSDNSNWGNEMHLWGTAFDLAQISRTL